MRYIPIVFFVLNVQIWAQTPLKAFKKLSTPEKCWVVFHPFKAKKAYLITEETLHKTDSVKNAGILDADINGGLLDAFKHSFWMARLTQGIGKNSALKLGKAHEKGNYKSFKKGRKEDGALPDKPSSEMDLFNNRIGSEIGLQFPELASSALAGKIIEAIGAGRMRILKKDALGRFLNCKGEILSPAELMQGWENGKCLINSNL